jgi:integrase
MQRRHVPTFEEAAKLVHADRSGAWKNKKHAVQWLTALAEYAFPSLGSRRVDQIGTPDVLMVLSPIWLSKPETARRVRQRIRAVMDWAGAAGHRSGGNPVDGVEKGLPRQQDRDNHHSALEYDDVPQFLSDLRQSDAGEVARLAFEFLILTATRTRETTEAKWSEVDFKAKTWTISASRMKTARNHRVPLSPRAIEILTRAKELSAGSEYIFPGRRPEQPLSDATLLKALRRMRSDITTHGFRSTFRDWAAERTNFSREVCEQALAHIIEDKTEAAYRRGDLFEKRRELMDAWAAFATGAKGTVIHLHSGRGR